MAETVELIVQRAVEEWATVAGGPTPNESPTLVHYIAARIAASFVPRDQLRPLSSWSRKWNPDGSLHCNHSDSAGCTATGHTTVILYELVEDPR